MTYRLHSGKLSTVQSFTRSRRSVRCRVQNPTPEWADSDQSPNQANKRGTDNLVFDDADQDLALIPSAGTTAQSEETPSDELRLYDQRLDHDPMKYAKYYTIDGVKIKLPDYDFSNPSWASRVGKDIGWALFWKYFEFFTRTDDEWEEFMKEERRREEEKQRLRGEKAKKPNIDPTKLNERDEDDIEDDDPTKLDERDEVVKRVKPQDFSTESGRYPMHSSQKREIVLAVTRTLIGTPGFVVPSLLEGVGTEKQMQTEPWVTDPEHPKWVDRDRPGQLDEWDMRARREKQEAKKEHDLLWSVDSVMSYWNKEGAEDNATLANDLRLMRKHRNEKVHFTEEELWEEVTDHGTYVDPDIVINDSGFEVINPNKQPDWAGKGFTIQPSILDWLEDEGRLTTQYEVQDSPFQPQPDVLPGMKEPVPEDWDENEDALYDYVGYEGGDEGIEDEVPELIPSEEDSDTLVGDIQQANTTTS